jgi:raffinose/stachyose/melibiose transport system permease protein
VAPFLNLYPCERPSVTSTTHRRRGIGIAPIALVAIVLYCLVLVYPLLAGAFLSFTNSSPLGGAFQFVGIKNYVTLIGDTQLQSSLLFTGVTALSVTLVANFIGLLFALCSTSRHELFGSCERWCSSPRCSRG